MKGVQGKTYCGQCLKVEGAMQKEGFGIEVLPSGEKWEGYWHEGKFTKGTYSDKEIKLTGYFDDARAKGFGHLVSSDEEYKGEFENQFY